MMTPPSPPSPFSPATPTEVTEAIREEKIKLETIKREKEKAVAIMEHYLQQFYKNDKFINALSSILKTHSSLEKRYELASAIANIAVDKDLEQQDVRDAVRTRLSKDVFDPDSLLYKNLNIQSTWILPLTFYGSVSWLSYNFSRSLQYVQSIIQEEMKSTTPLRDLNSDDSYSCFRKR